MIKPYCWLITLTCFCGVFNAACSNNYLSKPQVVHDTVYIEKQTDNESSSDPVLKGTAVLEASRKNMESGISHGLWLKGLKCFKSLEPEREDPYPTEITSIKQTSDSTLIIITSFEDNCAYDFLGEIEVVSGNTLNLIRHGYGGFGECHRLFGLTYKIRLVKEGEHDWQRLQYVTINGIAKKPMPTLR